MFRSKVELIVLGVLSLIAALFAIHLTTLISVNQTSIDVILDAITLAPLHMLAYPLDIKFTSFSAPAVLMLAPLPWLAYMGYMSTHETRKGEEHGSARWATKKEALAFENKEVPDNNIVLSEHYRLGFNKKAFDPHTDRNMNLLVVGGSGSGKTRSYVKPNLMQLNADYFVTDPKGTLAYECGEMFVSAGYNIKLFNTVDFSKSMFYNPLQYVKTDAEILSFVTCLMANTQDPDSKSSDPFWPTNERNLLICGICILRDFFPHDYTLPMLRFLISMAQTDENENSSANKKSPLDLMIEEIETGETYAKRGSDAKSYSAKRRNFKQRIDPLTKVKSKLVYRVDGKTLGERGGMGKTYLGVANYTAFRDAPLKTKKSILISVLSRLQAVNIDEVKHILSGAPDPRTGKQIGKCELALDELGEPKQKTVLFAIKSDTDTTFNFLYSILMWQAVNVLCTKAYEKYGEQGGRLPRFTHFILDEFATAGYFPHFEQVIAVTRSRNIGITCIVQSLAQLIDVYDEQKADSIKDNCDTTVFLGTNSYSTKEKMSNDLGKETIQTITFNSSRGQSGSVSKNQQIQERALMDPSEVGRLLRTHSIISIAGTYPILDEKANPANHARYAWIDPSHTGAKCSVFDIEKYLKSVRGGKAYEVENMLEN